MSQNHNYPIDYNKDKSGSIPAAPPISLPKPSYDGFFIACPLDKI